MIILHFALVLFKFDLKFVYTNSLYLSQILYYKLIVFNQDICFW